MRITRLQIHNYKSFFESDVLPFYPGFNVIVGRNNVGKTALVEALSLRFENKPHRSELTMTYRGATFNTVPRVNLTFEMGRDELLRLLVDNCSTFHIPRSSRFSGDIVDSLMENLSEPIMLNCSFEAGRFVSSDINRLYESINKTPGVSIPTYTFSISRSGMKIDITGDSHSAIEGTLAYQIPSLLLNRIYIFKAERLNVGQSQIGTRIDLLPDASNLAQVLHYLAANNPHRYEKSVRFANAIFPEIKHISAPPMIDNTQYARIQVWTIDLDTERDDLPIPLQECGTGIGQVLAILYVVLTSNDPRTIIIDKPQSFLHPGAIRKLIDILRQNYPQHQYIMTTHSPTVITSANPRSILLVRREDMQSVVEVINVAENDKLRLYLAEIGARLSDVFGADDILWVEGPTEEQCFPIILEKMTTKSLMGTTIVGVKHTGDFQRKDKQLVFNIYKRLSSAKGLLPPAIGFIFDIDGLNSQDQEDLIRESGRTVHFIPRKMYENYLLHPGAIAWLMNSVKVRDTEIIPQEIEDWLNSKGMDRKYLPKQRPKILQRDTAWFDNVHGTQILKDLFTEFSGTSVAYDNKPLYAQLLTQWLIENAPDSLQKIAILLTRILEKGNN